MWYRVNGAEDIGALHVEVDGNLNAREQDVPQRLAVAIPKARLDARKQAVEDLDEAGEQKLAVRRIRLRRVRNVFGLLRSHIQPGLPAERPVQILLILSCPLQGLFVP